MTHTVRSENPALYAIDNGAVSDDWIISRALEILRRRMNTGPIFDSPRAVRDYLQLKTAEYECEVFSVVFMDAQHRVIETREMFRGSLSQASVYPREVVKLALQLNAGAVVLSHNHPSGLAEPSRADEHLTQTIKSALALVDVRVLDHIITGKAGSVSFAERGLL